MYYVITLGQSDEKFAVGRNEYNRDGKISFVRQTPTFKSRLEADKLADKLNGTQLVDH
jgi:hypothetical protein